MHLLVNKKTLIIKVHGATIKILEQFHEIRQASFCILQQSQPLF